MTSTRRTHILFWLATAACAAGTLLVIASVRLWPVTLPPVADAPVPAARSADKTADTLPALASFDPVLRLNLRRPLVDPPPATQPAVSPPTAKAPPRLPGFRLVGTVIEPNHSYGIFASGLNVVEVRAVGQKTSSGAEVLEVTPKSAKLRHENRTITLALAEPSEPGAANSGGPLTTAEIIRQMRERAAAAAQGQSPSADPDATPKNPNRRKGRKARAAAEDEPDDSDEPEPPVEDPDADE